MICERHETCAFFNTYKNNISTRQYELLLNTYCEGKLQAMCRRMKWRTEKNEEPPADLCPNGYLVGKSKKFYD